MKSKKERYQHKFKNICFKCHIPSVCRTKEQDLAKYKNWKSKKVNKVENTTSDWENSSESSAASDCYFWEM